MKTIVLFKCPDSSAERHKLAGFSAVAKERGWNVQMVGPVRTAAEVQRIIGFWKPDGVTVSCIATANNLPSSVFGPRPVVYLGRPLTNLKTTDSFVCLDARAATELALRELLQLNLRHSAFVPWHEPAAWSDEYESSFTDIMSFNGKSFSIFPSLKTAIAANDLPHLHVGSRGFLIPSVFSPYATPSASMFSKPADWHNSLYPGMSSLSPTTMTKMSAKTPHPPFQASTSICHRQDALPPKHWPR